MQSPVGNDVANADIATAQRWTDATRYVESIQRTGKPLPRGRVPDPVCWTKKVQIISTIAAASSASTPQAGTGYVCDLVSGTWTATTVVITVYNPSTSGTVVSGSFVSVSWVGGIWEITMDPC